MDARFHTTRLLGTGSFGCVYEAYDQVRGQHVALKRLTRVVPRALMRFKREFRDLSGLSHPNLVALHGLMSDGGSWTLSMELLGAQDLLTHLTGVAGTRVETMEDSPSATPGAPRCRDLKKNV